MSLLIALMHILVEILIENVSIFYSPILGLDNILVVRFDQLRLVCNCFQLPAELITRGNALFLPHMRVKVLYLS